MGASSDNPSLICTYRQEKFNSARTPFRNKVCGLVCSGSSNICQEMHRTEGDDDGTDTSGSPDNSAEVDDGAKGQHRDLGILQAPKNNILFKPLQLNCR